MTRRLELLNASPARFVAAGAVNTGVSLLVYWALLTVIPYTAAYTIGFIVGMLTSFALNTFFVFRTTWSWRKLAAFPGVQAANYLVGLVLLWLLVHVVGVNDVVAPLLSIPLTIPFNFLLTRWLMLGRKPADVESVPSATSTGH